MTSWVRLRIKSPVRQVSSAALLSPNFFSSYGKIPDLVLNTKIPTGKMNVKGFIIINHLLIALSGYF
jgi:hypothetical protein